MVFLCGWWLWFSNGMFVVVFRFHSTNINWSCLYFWINHYFKLICSNFFFERDKTIGTNELKVGDYVQTLEAKHSKHTSMYPFFAFEFELEVINIFPHQASMDIVRSDIKKLMLSFYLNVMPRTSVSRRVSFDHDLWSIFTDILYIYIINKR